MIDRTKRVLTILLLLLITASAFVVIFPLEANTSFQEDGLAEADPLIPDLEFPTMTLGAEGSQSSDSILGFAETLGSDVGLDPDSDTNADAVYSEWDFSETIDPDVLYYPDAFTNGTTVASSGTAGPDSSTGAYTDTHSNLATDYVGIEDTIGASYVILNFTLPADSTFESFDYAVDAAGYVDDDSAALWVYDWTAVDYVTLGVISLGVHTWVNGTGECNPDYSADSQITLMARSTDADSGSGIEVAIAHITIYVMHLANSTYGESFADVSDWTFDSESAGLPSRSFTTDGDVLTFEIGYDDAGNEWAKYDASISVSLTDFIEISFICSATAGAYKSTRLNLILDAVTLASLYSSTWFTKRYFIGDYFTVAPTEIKFYIDDYANSHASDTGYVKLDYVRIGSVMGWGHDGSTTEGTEEEARSGWSYSVSSDSDLLTMTFSRSGGASTYGSIYLNFDTTGTEADLETDYYSWIELTWECSALTANDFYVIPSIDEKTNVDDSELIGGQKFTSTFSQTTHRINAKELTGSTATIGLRFIVRGDDTESATLKIDYIRAYGFNNWTYDLGYLNFKTSAVAYYDSGEDALVLQKEFDTNNDIVRLKSRNVSIGHSATDAVYGVTVKASANESCQMRLLIDGGTPQTYKYYFLYDSWQTIWMPMDSGEDYSSLDYIEIALYDWSDASPSSGTYSIYIKDNVTIRPSWYDASGESGTYGESFADVSDWNTGSTDGDVMTYDMGGVWSHVYTNDIGFADNDGYYVEYRIKTNKSTSGRLFGYKSDGMAGGYSFYTGLDTWTTSWKTFKEYIPNSAGYSNGAIESLSFSCATSNTEIKVDNLRIAPATEMGWQDDCSSVTPYDQDTYSFSDGDVAEFAGTQADYSYTRWMLSYLKQTDYPFVEIRWKAEATQEIFFGIYDEDGNYDQTALTETGAWTTTTINANALADTGNYFKEFRFGDGRDNTQEFWIDYVKFYSIANFTVTQTGSATTTDVAYVSDTDLVINTASSHWFLFQHDPALSIAGATYNVVNITCNSMPSDFYIAVYDGSWLDWVQEESRFAHGSSGTVSDFKFQPYSDIIISAIKFWEDNTAPTIDDFWIVPYTPTDDDSVTLTIAATELMNVYKVTFNAIESPSGFSDVDYSATESPIENDLWNYTFSSLTAGYYTWKVYVDDGAQNTTSILPVQIKENVLSITEIVLITATETLAQISGHSNKDASYSIYENDSSVGSGSVSTGWFSISWTKDTTAGSYIELGIIFTAGAYIEWVNGSYSVASATVLSVTSSNYGVGETTAFQAGYANLDCDYYIYEDDAESATGSLSAGDFYLTWTRQSSTAAGEVAVAIKFTDGTTTRWLNWTYSKALDVAFKVEQWWMSLQLGVESYVEFYVLTTWENATVYVYDNETLMTTVTESEGGVYSYFWMSETQGLHVVVLNITHGGTVYTRSRTYYIPDWAVTGLVIRWDLWTFQNNYTMITLESNWRNCTFYVYLNSSIVATAYVDPVTLNFTREINTGVYNLTLHAYGGNSNYTIKNIRYIVTEEGVSYDYSSVTGGVTYVYTYEGDDVTIHKNPTGVFIDQGTAAIVAVGSFLIIFTAFLVARELKQRDREKTERTYSQ